MPWTPLALRRGVALAPPRASAAAAERSARRPRGGGRGRPIALGLVGRAAGPAVDGDREKRALRDRRAGPLVDLGGMGLSRLAGRLVRRGWTPDRLRRARGRRLRGDGAGLRPGLLAAGPAARPPGRRVGLLRVGRPLAPPGAPVTLLYDDWDRNPYESPFGAFPHDLAMRAVLPAAPGGLVLPAARWAGPGPGSEPKTGPGWLAPRPRHPASGYIIGRDRDLRHSSGWAGSRSSRGAVQCASTGRTRCSGSRPVRTRSALLEGRPRGRYIDRGWTAADEGPGEVPSIANDEDSLGNRGGPHRMG